MDVTKNKCDECNKQKEGLQELGGRWLCNECMEEWEIEHLAFEVQRALRRLQEIYKRRGGQ